MPSRLPDNYKSLVIQAWLNGEQRDKIAVVNGLSAGSVTNIVNEWRAALGFPTADALRELGVTLRRVGITAAQCALGFRIATLIHKMGVKEDSFESFILDVYNRCKEIGLSPENISSYLLDLLEFSKTVMPLSKIPDYVREKASEKRKLEEQIEVLKPQIETLQRQKEDVESLCNIALQDEGIISSELKSYISLKKELKKYGIPVDDISKFAKLVNNIREYSSDPRKVMQEFEDLESLILKRDTLQLIVQNYDSNISSLEQNRFALEVYVSAHNQLLNKCTYLEIMGFGLKKLQFLWNTVNEIARENNIPPKEAITKFLSDVEYQYDCKLGFESKIESLQKEVNKLNQEHARLHSELLLSPLVGPKLVKLTQSGVTEQDIINIAAVFEKYIAGKDRQSFISELEVYGSLKSAIQELSKQSDKMRMEVGTLQTQNRNLNADNQRIVSSLVNLRYGLGFMQGYANSLRNKILGLVSISAYIAYSIELQFEYLEKLKSNNGDEFALLNRAYKGEGVSAKKIRKELIIPIKNMENKLEVKDRLTGALSNVRPASIKADD